MDDEELVAKLQNLPDDAWPSEDVEDRYATEFEYTVDEAVDENNPILIHTTCGSTNIEAGGSLSYSGTKEGYTKCLDCGHTETWIDI